MCWAKANGYEFSPQAESGEMWRQASLPAVALGFQPGGKNVEQQRNEGTKKKLPNLAAWLLKNGWGVFSGRLEAALYVRQGCLTLQF